MFICSFPACQKSYDKEWKLEAHLCKHTGVRPFQCQFEGCSKSFCNKSHLARHELTHTGQKPFSCTEDGCTQKFTTNYNRKKHISRKHKQEVQFYSCSFAGCGKSFKKNNLLKCHESTHTHQLPYQCTYDGCERRFANPSRRKRHEKVHKGYTCPSEGCTFVAKTWTEITKHSKEHKARVQCEECKKTFRDRWFLKQHQRVHTDSRMVFLCPRDGCKRSYTTIFNLQSHILSYHQQEKVFSCPEPGCSKTFAMKQSLQRHSVAHDPERKKQRKPRPTRSLASRLTGYKVAKKPRAQNISASQSEMAKLELDHAVSTSGSVEDDGDGMDPDGSELVRSESSVILLLEPLVLESLTDLSQSEITTSHSTAENIQSEITTFFPTAETSQSELSEFVNPISVQSEFKQSFNIVMTSQ